MRSGSSDGVEGAGSHAVSDGDSSGHGKVVVRGCIEDVCVRVVDDGDDDGVAKACSAEVKAMACSYNLVLVALFGGKWCCVW